MKPGAEGVRRSANALEADAGEPLALSKEQGEVHGTPPVSGRRIVSAPPSI